jgi:hypothetical protein
MPRGSLVRPRIGGKQDVKDEPDTPGLIGRLLERIHAQQVLLPYRPDRYEDGDTLEVPIATVWPEADGHARFRLDRFVGGGYAGQVYRATLQALDLPEGTRTELAVGRVYAVKILVPPTPGARRFRDLLYWLAFQGPFGPRTFADACRAGLLWQKAVALGMEARYGQRGAVAEPYASFYDAGMRAHGDVGEWIDGRTWRLEADAEPRLRRGWRTVDPRATRSPEYVAKRRFMADLTALLHELGAPELARQYAWWSMKSQPNVLKRRGHDADPAAGLCAVDFRAGLALLPYLPMSPVDVRLILSGIRRGSWTQFDRGDPARLRAFSERYPDVFGRVGGMLDALERRDAAYRRALPDLAHQAWGLLTDSTLRGAVRDGLVTGYVTAGLADARGAAALRASRTRFAAFYLLGAVPLLGGCVRRLVGNRDVRWHVRRCLSEPAYFRRAGRAVVAARLVRWVRAGRVGTARAAFLADRPAWFWLSQCTAGLLPFAGLHRAVAEPAWVWGRMRSAWRFMRNFMRDPAFREDWFTRTIEAGYAEGMLNEAERDRILGHVRDPFIVKYLKCLAVHFATLPVTQIVSLLTAVAVAGWVLARGGTWETAAGVFVGILVAFQLVPVSPGSFCRGVFVLILIMREGRFRDYMIAAPLSFVKYIGYLAFPFQMIAMYPDLARFMGSRWATQAVHVVPVFGERGALLEHALFDLIFNMPRVFGRWARPRIKGLLDVWLLLGLLILVTVFAGCGVVWHSRGGINLLIAFVAIFILPRTLFYPLL